jgi:hypothetical protein
MQTATPEFEQNVSRATILEFFDEYDQADNTVAEAVGFRKDLLARMTGEGIRVPAYIQMRKLSRQSGEEREKHDRAVRYYMACIGKPLGIGTAAAAEAPTPEEDRSITEHQRRKVHGDGVAAGRAGHARDTNSWSPGSLLYAIYDEGWREGAEALAQTTVQEEPAAANGEAAPKRLGRPPGSRNRPGSGGRRRRRGGGNSHAEA